MENFLTEFNTGGSHKENPLGGIPQGVGANGKINTVEEGETKQQGYVFSDKLILDDKLIKRYNLPKTLKGKTMAEASKKLNESFKETNSKIDKESTQEMIDRLTSASEEARISEELANMPDDNKKQLGGMLSQQNQMFLGGFSDEGKGPGVSAYLGAATGALELGNMAFGDNGIVTDGSQAAPDVKVGNSILGGTMKGAQAGMAFGPLGAGIGGVLGGVAGLIGGNKAKKDSVKADRNVDLAQNSQYRNTFEKGGILSEKDKKKKKEYREVTDEESIREAENSQFTPYGIKKLFGVEEMSTTTYPDLNLGKYGEVGYFNPVQNVEGQYTLNNTKKNPANYSLYKEQLNNIKKLNPGLEFTNEGFTPLINQKEKGGNMYPSGGRPYITPVNELNSKGIMSLSSAPPVNELSSIGIVGQDNLESLNNNVVDTNKINSYIDNNTKNQREDFIKDGFNKATDFLGENYGNIMRYAPVAANALQLANLKKPEVESLNKIDNRYKPDNVDERQLVNRASSEYNNVANSLKSATNGSVGALRSNLLAAHLNRTKGLSDSFLQADNINRSENRFGQQFNQRNDSINLRQSNLEKNINARNRASYDNNKSKLISQIGTDIGNIGLEEVRKKYPERMDLLYNYLGKYRKETI